MPFGFARNVGSVGHVFIKDVCTSKQAEYLEVAVGVGTKGDLHQPSERTPPT